MKCSGRMRDAVATPAAVVVRATVEADIVCVFAALELCGALGGRLHRTTQTMLSGMDPPGAVRNCSRSRYGHQANHASTELDVAGCGSLALAWCDVTWCSIQGVALAHGVTWHDGVGMMVWRWMDLDAVGRGLQCALNNRTSRAQILSARKCTRFATQRCRR